MNEVERLKIEVYNLREKLQELQNEQQKIQEEITKKVLAIRELEKDGT